ncbi:hypothetical protein FOA52_011597 [Chlamydomonas sp. UWO 241]|nr:hypothetical protein FOA52_011597 [Chlamydomonas sp. UWO 241]
MTQHGGGLKLPRFAGVRVLDAHLHVWSSTYRYAPGKEPPAGLGDDVASVDAFRAVMEEAGVAQALVVQPINYGFDHRCV